MRARIVLVILGCMLTPGAARADVAQAAAAYKAKQWTRCAELWLGVGKDLKNADPPYNAACCFALDGKKDKAFAQLDRAVAAGLRDLDHLQKDGDLVPLHGDARWAK